MKSDYLLLEQAGKHIDFFAANIIFLAIERVDADIKAYCTQTRPLLDALGKIDIGVLLLFCKNDLAQQGFEILRSANILFYQSMSNTHYARSLAMLQRSLYEVILKLVYLVWLENESTDRQEISREEFGKKYIFFSVQEIFRSQLNLAIDLLGKNQADEMPLEGMVRLEQCIVEMIQTLDPEWLYEQLGNYGIAKPKMSPLLFWIKAPEKQTQTSFQEDLEKLELCFKKYKQTLKPTDLKTLLNRIDQAFPKVERVNMWPKIKDLFDYAQPYASTELSKIFKHADFPASRVQCQATLNFHKFYKEKCSYVHNSISGSAYYPYKEEADVNKTKDVLSDHLHLYLEFLNALLLSGILQPGEHRYSYKKVLEEFIGGLKESDSFYVPYSSFETRECVNV